MKIKLIIGIAILSLSIASCNSKLIKIEDSGEISESFDFPDCEQMRIQTLDGLVIRDTSDLDIITTCNTNNLYIDFENYSILGLYSDGVCRLILDRKVSINPNTKTYSYIIKSKDRGLCSSEVFEYNLVKVPAIPDDYTVVFTLED